MSDILSNGALVNDFAYPYHVLLSDEVSHTTGAFIDVAGGR